MSENDSFERRPVVAGTFYPAHPVQLRTAVERLLERRMDPVDAKCVIVPHAGYVYSGATAGRTFASVTLPRTLFLLCPNHTGLGAPVSCWPRGSWLTPLGAVPVDEKLASMLIETSPIVSSDTMAHTGEHSAEVELPFLQVLLGEFSFVPVCVGVQDLDRLEELGESLAKIMAGAEEKTAIVVSSDMNHYESARTNREKDELALDAIKALDPVRLHRAVIENDISMCGFACAVAGLTAAKTLGANSSEVVDYTHSGMMTGDDSQVVSYAGVRVWREEA